MARIVEHKTKQPGTVRIQELDRVQQFFHSGLSWEQFKALQQGFDDSPGIRLAYYKGEVEILAVSPGHGIIAENLGFLLELWMLDRGIEFVSTGNMTVEREGVVSVQGDKSYCFGELRAIPDLSIEVVIKGEGISKLKRYAELKVPEVWFWRRGKIAVYHWDGADYIQAETSQFVPGINLARLAECAAIESRAIAVNQFRG